MNITHKLTKAVVVILILGLFTTPWQTNAQNSDLTFVIISHGGRGNPFWEVAVKGAEDACASLGVYCQWFGHDNGVWDEMAGYWDEALALNPDGIATTNIDPEVIGDGLEQAAERGIPVMVFNVARSAESNPAQPALLYIGSDDFIGGQTNARRVFTEAQADGVTIQRGVCFNPQWDQPFFAARCAGVESVFDEQGVLLDQVGIASFGTPEQAFSHLKEYLDNSPDTNAVFLLEPWAVAAFHTYIVQMGLQPRHYYATAYDTSPEIFQMIQDDYLLQTIDQQQYMQTYQTIMFLYLYRQYGIRPSGFIDTNSVVDRNNVENVIQLAELGYR
jgi:simple sugar transport system substrate-binding protein